MANVSIARRYARALIEVASETHSLDKALSALESFTTLLDQNAELREMAVNPAYNRSQRWTVTEKVLGAMGVQEPGLLNFFRLLVDRNRLGSLPNITRIFRDLADHKAGRVRGIVTSAKPLASDSLTRLEQSLERITQRNVVLQSRVDPSLIGGLSAQVGSVTFDGSLRNQIQELRHSLKSAH